VVAVEGAGVDEVDEGRLIEGMDSVEMEIGSAL
jgi:hypothetical protein